MINRPLSTALAWLLLMAAALPAPAATVRARVRITKHGGSGVADASNAVLWLIPVDTSIPPALMAGGRPQLIQSGKQFHPGLLVIPVGTFVDFPNHDPFFHNVFSLFEGKRFDLGLYEAGSTRTVRFDKPGVSYIFCNIHAQMAAVIITLPTPHYGISKRSGVISIPDVPAGRYILKVWYEGSLPEQLESLTREVDIAEPGQRLGLLRLTDAGIARLPHTNKYGRKYEDPPTVPGYSR